MSFLSAAAALKAAWRTLVDMLTVDILLVWKADFERWDGRTGLGRGNKNEWALLLTKENRTKIGKSNNNNNNEDTTLERYDASRALKSSCLHTANCTHFATATTDTPSHQQIKQ
mmetsp:Transcript_350/g.797  ORF Transcript_350/g.797 Transcript_350/m.797 type:complete len:114 (+) Transcript_350:406-747(+)